MHGLFEAEEPAQGLELYNRIDFTLQALLTFVIDLLRRTTIMHLTCPSCALHKPLEHSTMTT
jgi:hypothetical protein